MTEPPGLARTREVRPASAPIDVLSEPIRGGRDLSGVGQIGEELEEVARLWAGLSAQRWTLNSRTTSR